MVVYNKIYSGKGNYYGEIKSKTEKFSKFTKSPHKKVRYKPKKHIIRERLLENNTNVLWDEFEDYLRNDSDFQIKTIKDNIITVKALRIEVFHNMYIMGKLIGFILPFNCEIKIKIKNKIAENARKEHITYDFVITTDDNLYYQGIIDVIR